jgi:FSR family fosmidomycin resistance protein-like MFS transporter
MDRNNSEEFKTGKVLLISVTHFFHDMYQSFLSPLIPVLIEKQNITLKMAGLLTPVFRGPSLLQPFIGYIADRKRGKRFLPITLFFTSILMSLIAISPSYKVVLILIFFTGASASFYHAPAVSFLSNASGTRYGTGMSMFMTGGELARSLGPLYIVTILHFFSNKFTPLASIPGIVLAFILFFSVPSYIEHSGNSSTPPFIKALKRGGKGLILLIIIGILNSLTVYSFSFFLPAYMKESGTTLFIAGSSLSALEISGAFGALIGGTLSDKIGRKNVLITTSLCITLLINLFLLAHKLFYRMILLFLLGIFMFSPNPVRYAFAQALVPEFKGTVSSILMTFTFLSTTVAAILAGQLGDLFGLYKTFRLLSFWSVLAIPFIAFLPEKK